MIVARPVGFTYYGVPPLTRKLVTSCLRLRIEQWRKLSSFRIDRISFRSLKLVAAVAGGSQITTIITPERGKMCSITNGVPVNREEVLQYSQRWFESSMTCRRNASER